MITDRISYLGNWYMSYNWWESTDLQGLHMFYICSMFYIYVLECAEILGFKAKSHVPIIMQNIAVAQGFPIGIIDLS